MAEVKQSRSEEDRQPSYVVRAPDFSRKGRWVTVGYAWPLKSGDGLSVKLNSIPVGSWDGALVLLPPLQATDRAEASGETETAGR